MVDDMLSRVDQLQDVLQEIQVDAWIASQLQSQHFTVDLYLTHSIGFYDLKISLRNSMNWCAL